jgi:hypothetical protein
MKFGTRKSTTKALVLFWSFDLKDIAALFNNSTNKVGNKRHDQLISSL